MPMAVRGCVCPWGGGRSALRSSLDTGSAGQGLLLLAGPAHVTLRLGSLCCPGLQARPFCEAPPRPAVPRPQGSLPGGPTPAPGSFQGKRRNLSWLRCPVPWSLIFRAPAGLLPSAAGGQLSYSLPPCQARPSPAEQALGDVRLLWGA